MFALFIPADERALALSREVFHAEYNRRDAMSGWKDIYERLSEADRISPLDPSQLVELAIAAYLIGKDGESLATLIRAHQGFVARRDLRQAGGTAARIASIL